MQIVSNQSECTAAFRFWADTLIGNARLADYGWIIEGSGVVFTNYGHGRPGEITREVMLGYDPETDSSTVKIVVPNASKRDKGPATVLATDEEGRRHLLREGRLTANKISGFVIERFAELSGLPDVPLFLGDERSERRWYVVADLDAAPERIMAQASAFTNACALARSMAGGGRMVADADAEAANENRPTYGADEKGRLTTRTQPGGTTEVRALQGYVYHALKKLVGPELKKPKANGYCVDAMIEPANLLIEIKTGTSAQCIYEAVGQLRLYPRLVNIAGAPQQVLLIPDERPLKPIMTAAVGDAGIAIFTYSIDDSGRKPRISFPDEFIQRCRTRAG
ncbi:hypothetical protein [Sphingomonas sp. CFBP 13733]|uniref:hypothetical protein n=1 Tax=Sphingomonas sp. CFBP 13733 TaxID=2775291 RepID=UPI00177C6F25|nr:hypothetical protein [Sphingomonas sp. CFBP 13733]MBD8641618.1 hypothetical protein [Sphingomonas sp. CFBP 13733]